MAINKIAIMIGTRPTFIELAPVIQEMNKTKCNVVIYHSGQHYDKEMSDIFLNDLQIPTPHQNLNAGSGTFAQQISMILSRSEAILQQDKPDILVVEGDTNTAFGSALAAINAKIPIVHIEAGCRSYDKTLPEEINRILISHIAGLHFPPTLNCKQNLMKEGIPENNIKLVGHPIVDSINLVKNKIRKTTDLGLDIVANQYYYVTVHRDFNTDSPERLEHILHSLSKIAARKKIVFSVHPRTKKRIQQFRLDKYLNNIIVIPPVDYVTSLSLTKQAYAIISDSGGLTKESCLFGVPCISLRPNTEWIETLKGFSNQLAFEKGNTIMGCVEKLDKNYDTIKQKMKSLSGLFGNVGLSAEIAKQISNWEIVRSK